MKDEDFLELIANEFKVCITRKEIPTYKKAIFLVLTAKNQGCLTTVMLKSLQERKSEWEHLIVVHYGY